MSATLKVLPDPPESDPVENFITELARDITQKPRTPDDVLPPSGSPRYDDLANSERFLDIAGSDLIYCPEAKKWLIWKGTHWQFDREDFVFQLAADFARSLYDTATDKDSYLNAKRASNRAGFNAFLELAQRRKAVSIDRFDQQPTRLNCLNGTLDLETGKLSPHSRDDLFTRVVNANHDPEARSGYFEAFLARIQPDPAVRAFLQRSIGYSLFGSVPERSFWILYGTGNNGKSVFTNLFNNLLGEYASTTTTATVMQGNQSAIPNDVARLKGKRFILVPETEENERLNSALIKRLSGGDTVSARYLFGEWFDFYFSGKLWITTNHKPIITDHSKGLWDRLKLVPFAENIPAAEVVKADDLMSRLLSEVDGVLSWATQGARDYHDLKDLDTPDVIKNEIAMYRHEQDSIAQFIEERCQTLEQARQEAPERYYSESEFQIANSDLYAAYRKFCDANGEYARSHRRLSQNLKERGFSQIKSGNRQWAGIRLVD